MFGRSWPSEVKAYAERSRVRTKLTRAIFDLRNSGSIFSDWEGRHGTTKDLILTALR
jgi:hypothetical protein